MCDCSLRLYDTVVGLLAPYTLRELAASYFKLDDYSAAVLCLDRTLAVVALIDHSVDGVELLHGQCEILLGTCFSNTGRSTEARVQFERALAGANVSAKKWKSPLLGRSRLSSLFS